VSLDFLIRGLDPRCIENIKSKAEDKNPGTGVASVSQVSTRGKFLKLQL
jgi:hypothetical protein